MRHTLVTGMSATGKSTLVHDLLACGRAAIDLDQPAWSHEVPDDSPWADGPGATDWRWRDPAVEDLLAGSADPLVVSGTSTTQGEHYPWFGHVVLLTVPPAVAARRMATRTTNDHGKHPDELARALRLHEQVEPLLRRGACLELDTSRLDRTAVVEAVLAHLDAPACRDRAVRPQAPA